MEDKARLAKIIKEKALRFGDFTLASGKKSKYYLDLKQVTLTAEGSYLSGKLLLELVKGTDFEAVGGVTLGADPLVGAMAALSFEAGEPVDAFIIRKEPKAHGTGKLIEGPLEPGCKVIIVEDVATTGGSALKAVRAAEDFGCKVVKVIALVDREEGAAEAFREAGYPFSSVLKLSELLING